MTREEAINKLLDLRCRHAPDVRLFGTTSASQLVEGLLALGLLPEQGVEGSGELHNEKG